MSGDKLYEWINNTNCIEIYEFVEGESELRGKARVGNVRSADLTDAHFTGAKLDGVVWKGAKVEGAKFEESVQKQI